MENTNDNGEKLSSRAADIVLRQFKIYMVAVLQHLYHSGCEALLDKESTQTYIVTPFMPPALILRCWEMFMTYTKSYMYFCQEVFGGKILVKNNEPLTNADFDAYTKF